MKDAIMKSEWIMKLVKINAWLQIDICRNLGSFQTNEVI